MNRPASLAARFAVLALAGYGALQCGPAVQRAVSGRKGRPMMTAEADSPSRILRATHILLVRVESAQGGEWKVTGRTQERTVGLTLAVQEALKGELAPGGAPEVRLAVVQYAPAGVRLFKVPGAWSETDLVAGARFVVFCSSSAKTAEQVLRECFSVLPAAESLADARLAVACEREQLAPPAVLERIAGQQSGWLAAEYVSARLLEVLFHDAPGFDRMLTVLEQPGLKAEVRSKVLGEIFSEFLLGDPAPPPFSARLVACAFRLLALPEASGVHRDIVDAWLPNLLGLEGGLTRKTAAGIFAEDAGGRERAAAALRNYKGGASTERLAAWLRQ